MTSVSVCDGGGDELATMCVVMMMCVSCLCGASLQQHTARMCVFGFGCVQM